MMVYTIFNTFKFRNLNTKLENVKITQPGLDSELNSRVVALYSDRQKLIGFPFNLERKHEDDVDGAHTKYQPISFNLSRFCFSFTAWLTIRAFHPQEKYVFF